MLYLDIINEIQKYTKYNNLHDFVMNDQVLKCTCDNCGTSFPYLGEENIILYELEYFDNTFDNILISLLTFVELKKCVFNRTYKLFCNYCMYLTNKKLYKFNYCQFGISYYLTKKHIDLIKKNNLFITNDKFHNNLININRYNYNLSNDNDILTVEYLCLENMTDNQYIHYFNQDQYNKIKKYILEKFKLDLSKYIKI